MSTKSEKHAYLTMKQFSRFDEDTITYFSLVFTVLSCISLVVLSLILRFRFDTGIAEAT